MSWMTQAEAAAVLNCSIRTVRRRIRDNTLKARRDGRNVLVEIGENEADARLSPYRAPLTKIASAPAVAITQDADRLSAMSSVLKDTVSAMSEAREALAAQIRRSRRLSQAGWLTALAACLAVAAVSWRFHEESLTAAAEIDSLKGMLASREAGFDRQLAAAKGRFDGESNAAWLLLTHEQMRTEDLANKNATALAEFDELQHEHNSLAVACQAATAERDLLAHNLQAAKRSSDLVDVLRGMWTSAMWTIAQAGREAELRRALKETHMAQTTEHRTVDQIRADYESRLAAAQRQFDSQTGELVKALDFERRTVVALEDRIETLSDRLVEFATDRGRLRLEQVQLAAEMDKLRGQLEQARQAADLSVAIREIFRTVQYALKGQSYGPMIPDRQAAADRSW